MSLIMVNLRVEQMAFIFTRRERCAWGSGMVPVTC